MEHAISVTVLLSWKCVQLWTVLILAIVQLNAHGFAACNVYIVVGF